MSSDSSDTSSDFGSTDTSSSSSSSSDNNQSFGDQVMEFIGLDPDKPFYEQFTAPETLPTNIGYHDTIAGTDIPMPERVTLGVGGADDLGHRTTGGVDRPPSPIDSARAGRSGALQQKQKELADAFAGFTDDYFDDLSQSYTDFNNPMLTQSYDDAVRGIYEGFKSAGILSQSDLDAQLAGLEAQKAIEQQRLADNAMGYATDQRSQVEAERKKLSDQLSALVGGATSVDDINRQTQAIRDFDIAGKVDKLKTPNTKNSMDFFSGFNKVGQSDEASDPEATFISSPSPVSQAMLGEMNPFAGMGIQTPYQGRATKVIS
jgi:hypothetical protein